VKVWIVKVWIKEIRIIEGLLYHFSNIAI